jgi:hypothetical protein
MEQALELLRQLGSEIITHAPFLVGFILPPLVQVINKDIESSGQRLVVSLVICFLCGVILKWGSVENGNPEEVLKHAGLIFAESHTVYQLYFKERYAQRLDAVPLPPKYPL